DRRAGRGSPFWAGWHSGLSSPGLVILARLVTGIPAGILRFARRNRRRPCGRAGYPAGAWSSVEFAVRSSTRVGLEHFGNRRSGERSQYGRDKRGSSAASGAIKWLSGCRVSACLVSASACAHFRRASRADPAQPINPPAASSRSLSHGILTQREDSMTPPQMRFAFSQLLELFERQSSKSEVISEPFWASLHGIAELTRTNRFPRSRQKERVRALVELFTFPR